MPNRIIDVKWVAHLELDREICAVPSRQGHFHDFYQLVYTLEGDGYIYIDSNKYILKPDTLCIIPPEVKHIYGTENGITTIESKFYILDEELAERVSGCISTLYFNDDSFKNLLKSAVKEYNFNEIYKSQMIASIIYQVLVKIIRNDIAVETKVVSAENDKIIQKIEKYISKHLCDKITLADLAKEVYMNNDTFLNFYKKHTGMTPIKHIKLMRITRAKDFLRHSELNITQIAEKCGFSSVHHFSKRFKENEGVSPEQFRKECSCFADKVQK